MESEGIEECEREGKDAAPLVLWLRRAKARDGRHA